MLTAGREIGFFFGLALTFITTLLGIAYVIGDIVWPLAFGSAWGVGAFISHIFR